MILVRFMSGVTAERHCQSPPPEDNMQETEEVEALTEERWMPVPWDQRREGGRIKRVKGKFFSRDQELSSVFIHFTIKSEVLGEIFAFLAKIDGQSARTSFSHPSAARDAFEFH